MQTTHGAALAPAGAAAAPQRLSCSCPAQRTPSSRSGHRCLLLAAPLTPRPCRCRRRQLPHRSLPSARCRRAARPAARTTTARSMAAAAAAAPAGGCRPQRQRRPRRRRRRAAAAAPAAVGAGGRGGGRQPAGGHTDGCGRGAGAADAGGDAHHPAVPAQQAQRGLHHIPHHAVGAARVMITAGVGGSSIGRSWGGMEAGRCSCCQGGCSRAGLSCCPWHTSPVVCTDPLPPPRPLPSALAGGTPSRSTCLRFHRARAQVGRCPGAAQGAAQATACSLAACFRAPMMPAGVPLRCRQAAPRIQSAASAARLARSPLPRRLCLGPHGARGDKLSRDSGSL